MDQDPLLAPPTRGGASRSCVCFLSVVSALLLVTTAVSMGLWLGDVGHGSVKPPTPTPEPTGAPSPGPGPTPPGTPAGWAEFAKLMTDDMDRSADPCEDMYQFACGGWLNRTRLPADQSRFGRSFTVLAKDNEQLELSVLGEQTPWPKMDVFQDCMALDDIDAREDLPTQALFDDVRAYGAAAPDGGALGTLVGTLYRHSVRSFFSLYRDASSDTPRELQVAYFSQGGLGLPSRSAYFGNASEPLRMAYRNYLAELFTLAKTPLDAGGGDANATADAVLAFETTLAEASLPPAAMRDPFATHNPLSLTRLQNLTDPGSAGEQPPRNASDFAFHFRSYVTALFDGDADKPDMFDDPAYLNVNTPPFFSALGDALRAAPAGVVPAYLEARVAAATAGLLSAPWRDAAWRYEQALTGADEPSPRNVTCAGLLRATPIGMLVGRVYVRERPVARNLVADIIAHVASAFNASLPSISWLDDATRAKAREKLAAIDQNLVHPDPWPDTLDAYNPPAELPFYEKMAQLRGVAVHHDLAQLGQATDTREWFMVPQLVNAYYSPPLNSINFPAGILQGSFFGGERHPVAANMGAFGVVAGHEMGHGYDDQGSNYDGSGKLDANWWSREIRARFKERTTCLRRYFDTLRPRQLPPTAPTVNGSLTLGENVADLFGVKMAYHAYKRFIGENPDAEPEELIKSVFGLTREQLFFVSFSQTWCVKQTDRSLLQQLATDPHSPGEFRVEGPQVQFPPFADAFACKAGSRYNPPNRCNIW